jgi:electron transfer flavoprotein alpha/beta subunit
MNIIVCVKAVPHVIIAITLSTECKDICKNDFSYKINDTDRYASLSKIRLAQNKPIRKLSTKDLNASAELVDSWLRVRTKSCSTAVNEQTEFIHGTTDEAASKLAKIVESIQSAR